MLTTGDMRSTDDESTSALPEITTEELTGVSGGAGFADSFMQFLPFLMIMQQRQAPPPVVAAPPPPPLGDWTRVA